MDDAGNVIKELMDEYLERIRKVYENLGGKVVVDGGRCKMLVYQSYLLTLSTDRICEYLA